MKSFDTWFSEVKSIEPMLPENINLEADGTYTAQCCRCEEWTPLWCDISEVPIEDYRHWCGRSERCCP